MASYLEQIERLRRTLAPLVVEQFPEYLKTGLYGGQPIAPAVDVKLTEGGSLLFRVFLEAYYEWLASDGNPYRGITELTNFRDVDFTLDAYLNHFFYELVPSIPQNVFEEVGDGQVNARTMLKHVRDFYLSKGTPKSFEFFFRLLYGLEAEVIHPDFVRLSESDFDAEKTLRVLPSGETSDADLRNIAGREIIGETSGATVFIEKVLQFFSGPRFLTELKLEHDTLVGTFLGGETIRVVDPNIRVLTLDNTEDDTTIPEIGQVILGNTSEAHGEILAVVDDGDTVTLDVRCLNDEEFRLSEYVRFGDGPFVVSTATTIKKVLARESGNLRRVANTQIEVTAEVQPTVVGVSADEQTLRFYESYLITDEPFLSQTLAQFDLYEGVDYRPGDSVGIVKTSEGWEGSAHVESVNSGGIEFVVPSGYVDTGTNYLVWPTQALSITFNSANSTFITGETVTQTDSGFEATVYSFDAESNTLVVYSQNAFSPSTLFNIVGGTSGASGKPNAAARSTTIGDRVRFVADYLELEELDGTFEVGETITGTTTGTSAVVRKWDVELNRLWIDNIDGTFQDNDHKSYQFEKEDVVGSASYAAAKVRKHWASGGTGAQAHVVKVDATTGAVRHIRVTNPGVGYSFLPYVEVVSQTGEGADIFAFGSNVGSVKSVALDNVGFGSLPGSGWGWDERPDIVFEQKLFSYDKQVLAFADDAVSSVFVDANGTNYNHCYLTADTVVLGGSDTMDTVPFANCLVISVWNSNNSAVGTATLGAVVEHRGRYATDKNLLNTRNKPITDSYRHQAFAYIVRVKKELRAWRSIVKSVLHPAGMKLFAEYPTDLTISAGPTVTLLDPEVTP